DLHQPLHCAAFVTRAYPQGDHGGNALAVRKNGVVTTLHAYWDDLLGAETDYPTLDALATSIASDPSHASTAVSDLAQDLQPMSWSQEGLKLAAEKAYLDGAVKFADYNAYKNGQVAASDVPELDSSYHAQA